MRTNNDEEEAATDAASALSQILDKVNELSANQDKLLAENVALVKEVKALTNQVKILKTNLTTATQQINTINNGQQRLNRVFRDPNDTTIGQVAASLETAAAAAVSVPALPTVTMKDEHHLQSAAAATAEGEQTPCKHLKGSDNNLYLTDILISLRNSGTINIDAISKSTYPRDIVRHSGNTSYIRYCLELVEFVAASNPSLSDCIGTLADLSIDSNDEVLRNASEILANACAEKIEEFDGKKVRKKTAIGFGSRIRDYKKKIAQLMGAMNTDQGYTVENVDLIDREQFDALQAGMEGEAGTTEEAV